MAIKLANTFKLFLFIGVMLVQQAFGQQPRSTNVILPFYTPMNITSQKGNFWWLYPNGNGNKVNDIAGIFAIGAGGYIYDFPSNGQYLNLSLFNLEFPLDSLARPLNYRKILHQVQFGTRQSEFLVLTDGDIYLLNTNNRNNSQLYGRTSIIPDSLKGLKNAAFLSFNSGVIIDKNNRIYRTFNGGQSWERKGVIPPGGVKTFTITSTEDLFISNFSGSLQLSTDGGTTFRSAANNNEVFSNISFYNDNFALATSSFRFYNSTDRGVSWNELSNVPRGRPNYIEAISDSIWLLSTDSTIYKTENAGLSYSAVTSPCYEGRITKFITLNNSQGVGYAAIVNGNLIESRAFNYWTPSGLRVWDFNERIPQSDNEDVKELFVSDYVSVALDTIYPISFLTNSNLFVSSGGNFRPYISPSLAKQWASNSNGTIYLNNSNNIDLNDGYNNRYSSSAPKTYPTVTKLLLKNNRVYFIKPGTNFFYSLPINSLNSSVDSVPLATQGNLVDMDAYNDPNSFEIYLLGSDGKVFEYNVGTRLSRIINFPYPTEPLKLKLSKRLNGTPPFIGATDSRGRLFAAQTSANTLSDLNGTLITAFRDFAIAGDSLFALNTDNVFYISNISNPASIVWQKDSIEISRTLTQVHIGYYKSTDSIVGQRPGRLARNQVTNYYNLKPSILLTGTGPCMISTNARNWHNLVGSNKERKALPPLAIYPNPTKQRNFRIALDNPEWLTVSDITGKVIATFEGSEVNGSYQLSATLSGGIYIVRAKSKLGLSIGKLVLQ